MDSELTYLFKELEKFDNDTILSVYKLKEIILASMEKANRDSQDIDDSIQHDY